MAEPLVAAVKPGGRLVLTGILREQAQDVATGFAAHGVTVRTSAELDDWVLMTGRAP